MPSIIDSGLRTQDSGLRTQDSGLRTNYALLKYYSYNIGDEIQSVATRAFLPHVDYYVYREHRNNFSPAIDGKVKMIMNAWYMQNVYNFPPSDTIEPLLISMHFNSKMQNAISKSKRYREYLTKNGPVGCRDKFTMEFLLTHNIPAYFSGCMTTTLQANEKLRALPHEKYILCVNVSDDVVNYVRNKTDKPVYKITKYVTSFLESKDRFEVAKMFLFLYHNASAVITTNLHTSLPCLAFNTPVCLIDQNFRGGRFGGISEWINYCSCHEFLNGNFYDIDNPPENPKTFLPFRNKLIETCRNFTGFYDDSPTLPDNYKPDIFSIVSMMAVNARKNRRVICKLGASEIIKMFFRKSLHKIFPRIFKNIVNPDY